MVSTSSPCHESRLDYEAQQSNNILIQWISNPPREQPGILWEPCSSKAATECTAEETCPAGFLGRVQLSVDQVHSQVNVAIAPVSWQSDLAQI